MEDPYSSMDMGVGELDKSANEVRMSGRVPSGARPVAFHALAVPDGGVGTLRRLSLVRRR